MPLAVSPASSNSRQAVLAYRAVPDMDPWFSGWVRSHRIFIGLCVEAKEFPEFDVESPKHTVSR